jgi:tetratricopeptide (TPR) repeat protein
MKLVLNILSVLLVTTLNVNGQTSKYQKTIEDVFNRLNTAIGYGIYPPKLKIEFTHEFVAQFVGGKNEIQIEEAAYEVCRSMGKDSLDALAFILGHELTHYYKHHNWLGEQGSGFASKALTNELEKVKVALDTTVFYETQADKFGYYFAKKAGFSIKNGSEVLSKLYAAYILPDSLSPRYPTLNDRLKIANETAEEASELSEIFNVANLLFLLDQSNAAVAASLLFEQILQSEMGTREVYNNMGLCYLKMGLNKSDEDVKKLIVPLLHVDPLTLLDEQERSLVLDSTIAMEAFKIALKHFEDAYRFDKQYIPAQVNRAITLVLLKSRKDAQRQIEDIEELLREDKVIIDQMEYLKAFNLWYMDQSVKPKFINALGKNKNTFAQQFLLNEKNKTTASNSIKFSSLNINLDTLFSTFQSKQVNWVYSKRFVRHKLIDNQITYIKYPRKKRSNDPIAANFNAQCKVIKIGEEHLAFNELLSFIITNKTYETPTGNDSIILSKANGSFYLMVRKFNEVKFGEIYVLSSDY